MFDRRPESQAVSAALAAPRGATPDLAAEVRYALLALWRNRVLIGVILAAGLMTALLLAVTAAPTYRSAAEVLVGQDDRILGEAQSTPDLYANDIIVGSEVQVALSRAVAERAIIAGGLLYDPRINPALSGGGSGGTDRILPAYYDALTVEQVGRSRIISIAFTGASPEAAAAGANAVAEAYIAVKRDQRTEGTQATVAALEERVQTLRADVEARERAIAEYRATRGLPVSGDLGLLMARIDTISNQISDTRAALAATRSQYDSLSASLAAGRTEVPPALMNSGTLPALREESARIQSQLARLESIYQPTAPAVVASRRELASLEEAQRRELTALKNALETDVRSLESRLAEQERVVAELKESEQRLSTSLVDLHALERDAAAARDIFMAFLDRTTQLSELQGVERPSAVIVSPAVPPTQPISPNRAAILAGGLVASAFLSLLVVLWIEQADARLLPGDQAETWTGLAVLADLQPVAGGRAADAALLPSSGFANALRTLALTLTPEGSTLLVTGPGTGEGKTTVAVGLARVLGQQGVSVLLVGGSAVAGGIGGAMGVVPGPGLMDHLADGVELDSCIQADPHSGMDILPPGRAGVGLTAQAAGRLLETLRPRYDVVIIDGPGVAQSADAITWAGAADRVLLCLGLHTSRRTETVTAARRLGAARASVAGVVVNQPVSA